MFRVREDKSDPAMSRRILIEKNIPFGISQPGKDEGSEIKTGRVKNFVFQIARKGGRTYPKERQNARHDPVIEFLTIV